MSQEWRLRAACRNAPTDAPFARDGSPEAEGFVSGYCRPCPVRRECLEFALRFEDIGIYGGKSHRQRTWIKKKRKDPRPLSPCGTDAAYHRHRRRGEPICGRCTAAHTAATTAQYRAKQGVA